MAIHDDLGFPLGDPPDDDGSWNVPPANDSDWARDWQPDLSNAPSEADYGPTEDFAPHAHKEVAAKIIDTMRDVLAAQQGRTMPELTAMVRELIATTLVLDELEEDVQETFAGVFEVLLDAAANTEGGVADLAWLPASVNYDVAVRAEIAEIASRVGIVDTDKHPSSVWYALKETVQRRHARRRLMGVVSAIDERSTVDTIMDRFRSIEPPTTKRALTRTHAARTARQVISEKKAATAGRPKMRFSSGYRSLDIAFTGDGDPLGFIAPGEGSLIAGPTGTGKSSFSYGIIPALTQDLANWGYPEGKLIFLHTEEESEDKVRACGLDEGQAFHHLADNVVVSAIGTSREAIVECIYDVVIEANRRSKETNLPIDQFLPHILVLDYIQSIKSQNEDDTAASARTSELLTRGVQAWNPEEMSKFSGVDFQSYAGMAWPNGMKHHRVAGLYFAQLVKQNEATLFYRAGSRDCQLSEFVLEGDDGEPLWPVCEGDLRLFGKGQIRGSGIVAQNASTILILHRSRPVNNNASLGPDGLMHLGDTRARLILDKTRTGSSMKYVPMTFDLQRNGGGRAQYFDTRAEIAMTSGVFIPDACYRQSGDPILPPRVIASPLAGFRY